MPSLPLFTLVFFYSDPHFFTPPSLSPSCSLTHDLCKPSENRHMKSGNVHVTKLGTQVVYIWRSIEKVKTNCFFTQTFELQRLERGCSKPHLTAVFTHSAVLTYQLPSALIPKWLELQIRGWSHYFHLFELISDLINFLKFNSLVHSLCSINHTVTFIAFF